MKRKRIRRRRRRRQKGYGNTVADQLVNLATKNLVDTATVDINSAFEKAQRKIKKLFGKKKKKKSTSKNETPTVQILDPRLRPK